MQYNIYAIQSTICNTIYMQYNLYAIQSTIYNIYAIQSICNTIYHIQPTIYIKMYRPITTIPDPKCPDIPDRVNRIIFSLHPVVNTIRIDYDNEHSMFIEIYGSNSKRMNTRRPKHKGTPRLNISFIKNFIRYTYTIAKPVFNKLDLTNIVVVPDKNGSWVIDKDTYSTSNAHDLSNILYENIFRIFFERRCVYKYTIVHHYSLMKLHKHMIDTQTSKVNGSFLVKNDKLATNGVKYIYEILEKVTNEWVMSRHIPNIIFPEDDIQFIRGNNSKVITMEDISYPKSKPKQLSFSNKYKPITNKYSTITLRVEYIHPSDRTVVDPDVNTMSFIFSDPNSTNYITYDILSGHTNTKDPTIYKLLPGLVFMIIQKVFMTGNYIYLHKEHMQSTKLGTTSKFEMTYKNNSYKNKPNYSFPHNIVNILSSIVSTGNQLYQLYYMCMHRYYIVTYMSLYLSNERKLTSIKNVKEELSNYDLFFT